MSKLDEAQELAAAVLARLDQPDRKKAVIILEDIAEAHLARGSVNDAAKLGRQALAVLRETDFAMWLPKFEALAQGLKRWARHEPVRAFLEDYAVTKRQLAEATPGLTKQARSSEVPDQVNVGRLLRILGLHLQERLHALHRHIRRKPLETERKHVRVVPQPRIPCDPRLPCQRSP